MLRFQINKNQQPITFDFSAVKTNRFKQFQTRVDKYLILNFLLII